MEPGWFQIWSAEDALIASDQHGIPEHLPGYFAFGGNGGGELFVLPLFGNDRPVSMVPAIGMSHDDLVEIATDFAVFARAMAPRT